MSITAFIEQQRDDYLASLKTEDAAIINGGWCEDFANDVVAEFSEAEAYWGDQLCDGSCPGHEWSHDDDDMRIVEYCALDGHCFVEYESRYYDAECAAGVNDWRDLPFYKRVLQCHESMTAQTIR